MAVRINHMEQYVLNMRTRMPFRYGIASMTALPHLFLRLEATIDAQPVVGIASEGLPPKWFTKDPARPIEAEVGEMLRAIEHAARAARAVGLDSFVRLAPTDYATVMRPLEAVENEDWGRDYVLQHFQRHTAEELAAAGLTWDETES